MSKLDDTKSSNNNSSPTTTPNDDKNSNNLPPRPQILPGHGLSIASPHPHDVLSGRGGRINSHPGNVHFREMVDSYKREYLDPRTKKVEKARIAARIVSNVRSLEPPGRFLKEDGHTGQWIEIGDERAWKKAGQALRESAPEIRAEREQILRGLVGAAAATAADGSNTELVHSDTVVVSGGKGSKKKGGGMGRAADPPGPRHRPNPPEREGLANYNNDTDEPELLNRRQHQTDSSSDAELERMRHEYYEMQRIQAEQQRRMEQYQAQLAARESSGVAGGGLCGAVSSSNTSDHYDRDVYNEYQQMVHQQKYHQQQLQQAQQLQGGHNNVNNLPRFSNQDIAAAVMDSGLLPMNNESGLYGNQQIGSASGHQHHNQHQYGQHLQQQQQQQFSGYNNQLAADIFGEAAQNVNDVDNKTVSTMSSFDIQSMDMSIGGFSWNQSQGHQQSGHNNMSLISTGSTTQRSSAGRGGKKSKSSNSSSSSGGGMSALERKLEKVNEQHRRQQLAEMQRKQQMMMMMTMQAGGAGGGVEPIEIPTTGGATWTAQQQQLGATKQRGPTAGATNTSSTHSRKYSHDNSTNNNNNMASITSFGFDAIEEDESTEASYKISNLGLSEMDMTFSSDVLSVRSKSVPKMRVSNKDHDQEEGGYRRKGSEGDSRPRRSNDDGETAMKPSRPPASLADKLATSAFNQSLSSNSSSGVSSMSKSNASTKATTKLTTMDDFNESFKSMDMSTGGSGNSPPRGGGGHQHHQPQQKHARSRLPDPDGQRPDGPGNISGMMTSRRKADPGGCGGLGTIHSSRASKQQPQQHSASTNTTAARGGGGPSSRRGTVDSIDDPNMSFAGQSTDFGLSFQSIQSVDSNAWLSQYNSMGDVNGGDASRWDDEDAEQRTTANSSDGASTHHSNMSEISAPRMITATGGDV